MLEKSLARNIAAGMTVGAAGIVAADRAKNTDVVQQVAHSTREIFRLAHPLPPERLLATFPGIDTSLSLSPEKARSVKLVVIGDSIMHPHGRKDTPHDSFDRIIAKDMTARGVGDWRSFNYAEPGAVSWEVLTKQLHNSDVMELLSESEATTILVLGVNGNDFRGLIQNKSDSDRFQALTHRPLHPDLIDLAKRFLNIQKEYGETIGKTFQTVNALNQNRLDKGLDPLSLFITLPYDYGKVPRILFEALNRDHQDLNTELKLDTAHARRAGYIFPVAIINEIGRQIEKFKPQSSGFLISTVSTFGLEQYCPDDLHLGDEGHKVLAKRIDEKIQIVDQQSRWGIFY